MSGFNKKDIELLRKSLEDMRPEISHDQYAVLDSITLRIEDLSRVGINPKVETFDRIVCWAVLLASVDKIFKLAMEERYDDIEEGLELFNDTVDYLMKGKR